MRITNPSSLHMASWALSRYTAILSFTPPPSSVPSSMSVKDGCAFFVAAERRAVQNMYLKERKDLAEKGKVSTFPCEW